MMYLTLKIFQIKLFRYTFVEIKIDKGIKKQRSKSK